MRGFHGGAQRGPLGLRPATVRVRPVLRFPGRRPLGLDLRRLHPGDDHPRRIGADRRRHHRHRGPDPSSAGAADRDDAPPARRPPPSQGAGGSAVGLGVGDLRTVRVRQRGSPAIVCGQTRSTAFLPTVDLGDGWIEEVDKAEFGERRPGSARPAAARASRRPGSIRGVLGAGAAGSPGGPQGRAAGPVRPALLRRRRGRRLRPVQGVVALGRRPARRRGGDRSSSMRSTRRPGPGCGGSSSISIWSAGSRSHGVAVDEPLRYQLADPRTMTSTLTDSTYVRIVDLPEGAGGPTLRRRSRRGRAGQRPPAGAQRRDLPDPGRGAVTVRG